VMSPLALAFSEKNFLVKYSRLVYIPEKSSERSATRVLAVMFPVV
jgi:hypothetical protein